MFFKLSAPHVSIREYLYEGNWITMPLILLVAVVVKLLRIPLPGSTDIPPVRSLQEFRGPPESMDPEIETAISDMDRELQELGFSRVDFLAINDVIQNTRYGGAVYRSADGEIVAWVRYRLWPNLERRNKFARLALYSLGPHGEVILTTAATRDLLDPPEWDVEYQPKLAPALLQDRHREHVRRVLGPVRTMKADNSESAFGLLQHTHEEFVEFQLGRGVFVETDPAADFTAAVPDGDEQPESAETPAVQAADEFQAVIEEVRRQENKQSGWVSKLLILAVSIAFFIGLGVLQWELELVLILVPILFIHELGHYAAMKVFGYKNIHMFFIPLLGAAVSGRHYRVSGWKKSAVALAGPLPSIVIGLALGIVGIVIENEWCLKGSLITMILNVLNLAPFLPLDGGQVAHVTLFSRSNFIDLLFRVGTIIALLGIAAMLKATFLFALGIAMVVGLPTVWRTLNLTDRLRNRGLPEPTDDSIPDEAIRAVAEEIRRSNIPTQGTSSLAKLILTIYEAVIIRPPSWPATLGIWTIYCGGLMVGVVGMVAVTVASMGDGLFDFLPEFEEQYERVAIDEGDFRLGKNDRDADALPMDLLAWRFADADLAAAGFESLKSDRAASVARFGQTVFTSRVPVPAAMDGFEQDFGGDLEAQLVAMEGLATDDPRLNELPAPVWRRSFRQSYPQLIVVADQERADAIVEVCKQLPQPIGRFAPLAPWTPNVTRTDEQIELHHRLMVLQGNTDQAPWKNDAQPQPNPDAAEDAEEDFREQLRRSATRLEQMQRERLDWIKQQAAATDGVAQRLYQAHANYEMAALADRQIERGEEQQGQPPLLQDYLEPLLPELGFLHRGHPLLATGASVQVHRIDPAVAAERFGGKFPLPHAGRRLLALQIQPTHDAAAGFAVVHEWLDKQGITDVVWTYSTPKSIR